MRKRISVLVAIGFAFLLGLGVLTSLAMIAGLRETMTRAEASQASALEVRAAVRSLRADYLASGDAVSRLMMEPELADARIAKRQADDNATEHLASAVRATRRKDLGAVLDQLATHDHDVTNRIEDDLIGLVAADAVTAKRVYFEQYLPARARNMELVDEALRVATAEVADAAQLASAKARQTIALAGLAFGLFVVVGTTSGIRLSGSVRKVARDFEEAAAIVGEQRDRLRAVMTTMHDALIVVDARGCVTMANDAACTLFGCREAELIGSPLARYVDGGTGWPSKSAEVRNERITFLARSGTRIPMSVSVAMLAGPDGEAVGSVWLAHDMRVRLRLREEMEAARDTAVDANRIKSEFLANMSHEIRTPMNAIIGFTDLVLESAIGAEQREYLGHVRQSSEALLAIINEVLDLSKIEAGKLRLDHAPFSLRQTVHAVLGGMAIRADEKKLELAVDVRSDVPDAVVGDMSRLRQVLLNLVGNAIKFTERGEVVVRVTTESDVGGEGTTLRFSVADTGIGIPVDKHRLVFQAFTQADGSMTRRYEGTGLGLAIASQLVEMMGGRIWLDSTVGEGSTFHFTARVGLQRDALPLPSPSATLTGLRLLVVDDSATVRGIVVDMLNACGAHPVEDTPTNRRMLTVLLEKRGYTALAVEDGLQAIAAIQAGSFDVVLMDVQMPRMDGLTATAGIRAREKHTRTRLPIIALTAHAMNGDRERCLAAGMDAYVSKPVEAEELFRVMHAVVTGARNATSAERPSTAAPVHVEAVLRQVGGNRAALAEVIDSFRKDSARTLDALRSALARRDGNTVESAAHRLRAALTTVVAPDAAAAALRLEEIGREGDFRSAAEAWTRLTSELERLEPQLAALGERAK